MLTSGTPLRRATTRVMPLDSCARSTFGNVAGTTPAGVGTALRSASTPCAAISPNGRIRNTRSEEHTSELQSLMRISYAVFCLKKKTEKQQLTIVQTIRNSLNYHEH